MAISFPEVVGLGAASGDSDRLGTSEFAGAYHCLNRFLGALVNGEAPEKQNTLFLRRRPISGGGDSRGNEFDVADFIALHQNPLYPFTYRNMLTGRSSKKTIHRRPKAVTAMFAPIHHSDSL